MKKKIEKILDFVMKNKYILAFLIIIIFLYAIGILKFLAELIVLLVLIALAIYFGKKLQDNNFKLSNLFKRDSEFEKKGNVYYYKSKKDNDKTK